MAHLYITISCSTFTGQYRSYQFNDHKRSVITAASLWRFFSAETLKAELFVPIQQWLNQSNSSSVLVL